jgi:hypothetical protein
MFWVVSLLMSGAIVWYFQRVDGWGYTCVGAKIAIFGSSNANDPDDDSAGQAAEGVAAAASDAKQDALDRMA